MRKIIILVLLFVTPLLFAINCEKRKSYEKRLFLGAVTFNQEDGDKQIYQKLTPLVQKVKKEIFQYENYRLQIVGDTSCGVEYERYGSDAEDPFLDGGIALKKIQLRYFRSKEEIEDCSRSRSVKFYLCLKKKRLFDGDHDGVVDDMDKCPNTPRGSVVASDGCVHKTAVVLLPGKKEASAIVVKTDKAEVVVDKPLVMVELDTKADISPPKKITPQELHSLVGDVAEKSENKEYKFTLYFKKMKMVKKSKEKLKEMLALLKQLKNPYIRIVGHTDTFGTSQENEILGLERAEMVAKEIQDAGVDFLKIQTMSMGERSLAVETPDETSEPKNRRVEISIQ